MIAPRPDTNEPELTAHQRYVPAPDALAGRVIALTGAGAGLGRAVALAAAAHGAQLVLIGRTVRKLEEVHAQITAMGRAEASIAPLDLEHAVARDYDQLAAAVEQRYGRLDGLVHSAAILGALAPTEHYDVPTWCRVLHVNLTAPFILTQVLLPHVRKSPDASVIFVSSGVVRNSRPFWGAYAVAKTGLESVRSMWSQELEGEPNIRINSVNPGRMRTAMRAAAYPGEDPNTVPPPAAVCAAFLYLLSAESRGIDGQYFEAQ